MTVIKFWYAWNDTFRLKRLLIQYMVYPGATQP
jgi:hypothetical protein